MLNTSATDFNYTSDPINIWFCANGFHVGMVVASVAVSLCFILGAPAQCWLLWVYLRVGWKIKPTQVFPLNMTILELIFCSLCAFQMLNLLIFHIATAWRVSLTGFGLCWAGRPLMQICICVEQYLAVIHPIMFLKYKGVQYRIGFSAVVWMIAAGYAVFEAFADRFPDPIFNSIFLIAMIIISFCCVSVLRALKHPGPGDTQIPVERGRDVGNQQKRKAFNTIFSGLLIILITYLPQVSLSSLTLINIEEDMFYCNIVPIINSFIVGVTITPMLKMYKNVQRKQRK